MAVLNIDNNYELFGGINNAVSNEQAEMLKKRLAETKDNNGLITGLWNGVKNTIGLGTSDKKCNEAIEAFKRGEISFEEADGRIKEYSSKQESSLNLFSNIAASVAALGASAAAAAAGGGASAPLLLAIASGTGALTKAGFKFLDRASNNKDNDAVNLSQLSKDALSGAVTGGIAAYTMGTASSTDKLGFKGAVASCTKTGVKSGAAACAANYAIDCTFDENKDFKTGEFLYKTAEGAAVGGAVGAIMGAFNASLRVTENLKSGCGWNQFLKEGASKRDVAANSICTAEYKVWNDRLRAVLNTVIPRQVSGKS